MLLGQVTWRLQKKRKGLWMPIGCSSPWQAIFFGLKTRRKNEGSLRISFSNCRAATAVHIPKLPLDWVVHRSQQLAPTIYDTCNSFPSQFSFIFCHSTTRTHPFIQVCEYHFLAFFLFFSLILIFFQWSCESSL